MYRIHLNGKYLQFTFAGYRWTRRAEEAETFGHVYGALLATQFGADLEPVDHGARAALL